MDPLRISSRVTLPAADLSWTAVRSSGPGGQNVNKVASKVDLRFDLAGCEALAPPVKARLRKLAGPSRLDAEGRVVLVRGAYRDQPRNLEAAREDLAALVRRALVPPKKRRPTKPTRGSKERRIKGKKARGQVKAGRRPVKGDD